MDKDRKLIFEISKSGRRAFHLPKTDVLHAEGAINEKHLRNESLGLPEVAELDLIRHYTALSRKAHGVDNGFYPLGSCTMKYNPRINEDTASLLGFNNVHPLQRQEDVQGCLELMYNLQEALGELTGMDRVTLQPSAGAQGEWTGLLMIKAYHESRQDEKRKVVLVPDSAHGTNPASASMLGYEIKTVPSAPDGGVDIDALKELAGEDTAALMLTNPNTLGLFEERIVEMAAVIHEAGGLLYYDGANFNAIMGMVRPGDMGFDVIHLNIHKTLSTPHGGGGPGSGPVGCVERLAPFLPTPVITKSNDTYELQMDRPQSKGPVKSFYGNFLVLVKAYTYILSLGGEGLKAASQHAVLNANYMMKRLKDTYHVPYDGICMHEFVMSADKIKEQYGVSAMDVSKALLDYGIHPPTMYFPLIVPEALMIEPTETESKETLDVACDVFIEIANMAKEEPESLHAAPLTTPVSRIDEVAAARKPIVRYTPEP